MQQRFLPKPIVTALLGATFLAACGGDSGSTDGTQESSSAGGKSNSSGGTDADGSGAAGSGASDVGGASIGGGEIGGSDNSGGQSTGGSNEGGAAAGGAAEGGSGGDDTGTGGSGIGGSIIEPSLSETLIPFQEWDSSSESLIGVLYAGASDVYGATISWGRGIGTTETPQPYLFSSNGSSPYALYFPSTGEGDGENFLEDWNVGLADGETVQYDAARFGPHTPNTWGLERDAYIVALQINDGRGSNDGLHFMATDILILEESVAIPMRAIDAMANASDDFDTSILMAESEIASRLEEARGETSAPADTVFEATSGHGVWPTWIEDTETLQLTFMSQRGESWSEYLGLYGGSLEGGERKPSIAAPLEQWQTHSYAVEYLIVYLIDPEGVVQSRTEHGPQIVHLPTGISYGPDL